MRVGAVLCYSTLLWLTEYGVVWEDSVEKKHIERVASKGCSLHKDRLSKVSRNQSACY